MTTLSGPVGMRNGVTRVKSTQDDQGKVIRLLWSIDPSNGGPKGVSAAPAAGPNGQCPPVLVAAITAFQVFWVGRGEFTVADSVVDPGGRSLRKLDALAGGVAPIPPPPRPDEPNFIDLKVLRFRQTLPGGPTLGGIPSIAPGSITPYLFMLVPKGAALVEDEAKGTISEFLFKIEKNGAIFWVGAAVPAGTVDFSRAYIFFHPDTMGGADNATYPSFSGRWLTVQRYVNAMGRQMAAMKPMTVIVPFMTLASRSNDSRTNIFGDQGAETLDDILSAVQISFGQTTERGSVQQVGVASYSSGVDHLFRFAAKLGGTGLIREQIDFDSAYMISGHKNAPILLSATNWMVTQASPPVRGLPGWLHLPWPAFRNVKYLRSPGINIYDTTHGQIGNMMFQSMMMLSVMR